MPSPKKRKGDELKSEKKTKQSKQDTEKRNCYTEIEFKFDLRQVDTTFSALTKFVDAAEKYPDEVDYDIVGNYVQSSEECAEIFKLLDEKRRKPQEILSIFSTLECIFIRLSDAGGKLELLGDNLVQRMLTYHMPVLYFSLGLNNKNQLIKKTLRLLTHMVAFSAASARAVQSELDFNHVNILPLCQRRDLKDSQDVRTCFIHFIMAFLLIGDEIVVRQMVEQKVLLQKILHGIESDKVENIQLILTTLLEKIVQSTSVSKTGKIHLFTETILKHICQLFAWQGPKHWKELKDKKDVKTSATATAEEREVVGQVTFTFLTELCCSFKTGINFYDVSLGTSGKNQNHILTGLLSSLQKWYTKPLCSELIVSLLRACPDQLHHFLSIFAPSLNPRSSQSWLTAMDFLIKIYDAQPETLGFLGTKSSKTDLNYLAMSLVYILPPDRVMSSFAWGIKQQSQAVRHKILEFLKIVLQKTQRIMALLNTSDCDTTDIGTDLASKLKDAVLKKLPDSMTLLSCLNKLEEDKTEAGKGSGKEELPPVNSAHHLLRLEQVLCLYQELVPTLLSDNPAHISTLLEGVRMVGGVEETQDEDQLLPQLYLLKLLAGTDARQLPWAKENASKHTLMYLLLEMVTKVTDDRQLSFLTQDLVGKLLQSTGLFPDQDQELTVWLHGLKEADSPSVVDFCSRMLTTFISNPYPYMDKVTETIAESAMDGAERSNTGKVQSVKEKTISEILAIDMDDSWDTSSTVEKKSITCRSKARYFFSPLTVVGQELMAGEDKFKNDRAVSEFLVKTQFDILHTQIDPVPYATLVGHHGDPRHAQYITSWIPGSKPWKPTKSEKHSTNPSIMIQLLWQDQQRAADAKFMDTLTESLETENQHQQFLITRQLLLYIRQSAAINEGVDNEQQLSTYFQLLTLVAKQFHKAFVDSIDISDSISSEFEMLHSSKKSPRDMFNNVVTVIFQHPTIIEFFLHQQTDAKKPQKQNSIYSLLTKRITDIFFAVKDASFPHNILKTFEPYAEKVMTALRENRSNSYDDEGFDLVLQCLENILPFLEPSVHYGLFLEELLELPSSILIQKSKSKLSEAGELVKNLAAKTLADVSVTKGRQLLKFEKVSKLMNLKTMCTDKFLYRFCTDLLETQPAYALAVDKNLACYLFDKIPDEGSVMAERLLCHNVISQDWFDEWLNNNQQTVSQAKEDFSKLIVCFVKLIARRHEDNLQQCLQTVEQIYLENISQLHQADSAIFSVCDALVQSNSISEKKLKKIWKHLSAAVTEDEDIQQCHLELLVRMCRRSRDWGSQAGGGDGKRGEKGHVGEVDTLFELLMKFLIQSSGRKHGRVLETEKYCLSTMIQMLEKEELQLTDSIASLWLDFVKVCLKAMYQEPLLLAVIEKIVPIVYSESHDVSPPIEMLYEMLVSHSQFMQVMLGEKGQEVKDKMVSLLLTLVEICPDCCHPDHTTILQGAYGATLSVTDQKLLKIIFLYEINEKGLTDGRPFLWGVKAIEHYALKNSLVSSLLKQPSMEQIVESFDPKKMHKSSLHFPIGRKLKPEVMLPADHLSTPDVYDPSFVLPLFCGLLSSDCLVDCRKFVSSHCLAYTLTALSSHDPGVRRAAYTVLARYLDHLATGKFHERLQVTYLLDTLRNSVQQTNERLPCLISVFLARVSQILLHPDEHMYRQLNNFLLLKPSMDISNVPEFYKLFNSADLQFKVERSWILNLLADGLREMSDYKIMERRFTFKLLQSFYDSAMSDQHSQTRVLRIMKAAFQIRVVCMDLAKSHGVLTWISGAVLREVFDHERDELITSLVHSLWFTMLGEESLKRSLPEQFVREILLCCRRIIAYIRLYDFAPTTLWLLTETMVSALNHNTDFSQTAAEAVTIKEVLLLMYSCTQLRQDAETASKLKAILHSFGIHIQISKISERKKLWRKDVESEDMEEKVEEEEDEKSTEKKSVDGEDKRVELEEERAKILDNVCQIIQRWNLSSFVVTESELTDSVQCVSSETKISATLVAVFWMLKQFQQFSSIELKTKVLSWISSIFMNGEITAHVLRRVITDTSDLSSQILANLLTVYSVLSELKHQNGFSQSDLDGVVTALSMVNRIVLCLVEDESISSQPEHEQLKLALDSTRVLLKEKTLASQEKAAHFLQGWLLGSRSGILTSVDSVEEGRRKKLKKRRSEGGRKELKGSVGSAKKHKKMSL